MKKFIATMLLVTAGVAFAEELTIDWTWKKDHFCANVSPALIVGNVPAGTRKLEFQMNDLDYQNYDHGGGTVDVVGDENKITVPDGALKQYRGPCPRAHFYGFGHDYVIAVKALGADSTVLASGSKKQNFSSKSAQ
jgi:hypothetical protein